MTKEEAKNLSDILKSAADGKTIQYKANNEGSWKDLPLDTWHTISMNYYEFRIKPEPKYRPYANAEEFFNAQKEHGLYLISKNKRDRARIPVMVQPEKIFMYWLPGDTCFSEYTYSALLAYWLHQDGTPCGIVEE